MSVTATSVGRAEFSGINGAGAVSVPGLKVGDIIQPTFPWQQPGNTFESVISVDGQIQQLSTQDLSAQTFVVIFFRGP